MRYIDTGSIKVPANWKELAEKHFGSSYSSLWSYFKKDMENIVGKKCWYSESINNGSNNPIDHFRPKGTKIRKIPVYPSIKNIINTIENVDRNGYPFLEFEFSNYRYACDIVNSPSKDNNDEKTRGKWDYFPLKKGSISAKSLEELSNEMPALLDPCNQKDVEMLSFNSLGFIEPHVSILNTTWEYCRVKVSIEVYHLHFNNFREKRIVIWNSCKKLIELIDDFVQKLLNSEKLNELEKKSLEHYKKELSCKIKKNSEFSAVAIDCIRFYKQKYEWLENFFPDSKLKK